VDAATVPWGAPRVDLEARGYVCEEYRIEGTAVAYEHAGDGWPPEDGRWAAVPAGEAAYRTRILVVRPCDPTRFNGTVIVHWQNVSAGAETGRPENDELYRGYAWVGVSAQEVGLYGLPTGMGARGGVAGRGLVDVDPERYGDLSHPGDAGSFEIFGRAAAAVGAGRHGDVDPMGGLAVDRLVATGASQSAMRLMAYANGVHPIHRALDGFLLSVWEGRAPRLHEGPIGTGGVRVGVRRDLGVPMLVVNSEFEATGTANLDLPDTDTFRLWEVAGTAHAVPRGAAGDPDVRGWVPNRLSWAPVHEAALRQMHRWLSGGPPAPGQPRIEVERGRPAQVVRDSSGNALGGIRLPEMVVPVAEYRGMAFGTGRPPLFGGCRPFAADELRARYRSRRDFTDRWRRAVDELVRAGSLLDEDAGPMRQRGETAAVALPIT
jgi:hypothetical protein